ncbi:c-type cytochrome [Hoeflea sp. AS60]|uniref:c-type cytochrome n=1 Tax=Hoeflea sp. AS60 TaxID=3135780 RepID=UPI00317A9BF9
MSEQAPGSAPRSSSAGILSAVRSFLPKRPLHWIGAGLTFCAVGALAAFTVASSGVLDLSAVSPHPEGWANFLHFTFQRSVAAHAEAVPESVSLDDPALIMAGAAHYANVCATCHGAPGMGQNPVALSMRPEPPMLLEAATRYSDGELFRIVSGGARYSAMPAWPVHNRPDEVWAVVAFLKALPGMDRARYEMLAHANASFTGAGSSVDIAEATTPNGSDAGAPGKAPRPYLPGDPQSLLASPHAADRPATGFVQVHAPGAASAVCSSCHGVDGAGRDGGAFPNLTLQTPEYIAATLQAFASGERQSGIMWPVAANLSEADIKQLAAEFGDVAAMPSLGADASVKVDPRVLARGKDIALNGIARKGAAEATSAGEPVPVSVQACQGCHGLIPGRDNAMPHIAGQNAAYLANQLRLFRDQGRGNSLPYNPMSIVSHKLDDPDIEALAAYYASLPAEKGAGGPAMTGSTLN